MSRVARTPPHAFKRKTEKKPPLRKPTLAATAHNARPHAVLSPMTINLNSTRQQTRACKHNRILEDVRVACVGARHGWTRTLQGTLRTQPRQAGQRFPLSTRKKRSQVKHEERSLEFEQRFASGSPPGHGCGRAVVEKQRVDRCTRWSPRPRRHWGRWHRAQR